MAGWLACSTSRLEQGSQVLVQPHGVCPEGALGRSSEGPQPVHDILQAGRACSGRPGLQQAQCDLGPPVELTDKLLCERSLSMYLARSPVAHTSVSQCC